MADTEVNTVDYEVFRKNHFEVLFTDYNHTTDFDEDALRLAITDISLNRFTGKISVCMYATKNVLTFVDGLYENKKLHLKYIMYSPDCSNKYIAFDDDVKVKDVIFASSDASNGDGMKINIVCGFGNEALRRIMGS